MYHHLWLLFRFLLVQCEVFPLVRCFQLVSATVQNQPRHLLLDLNGRQKYRPKVKRKPLLLKDVVMILIKVSCGRTIRQDQNVTANFTLGG